MSSRTQTDLSEFEIDTEEDESDAPSWSPMADEETDTGARASCLNCGLTVTSQFARVFGDNNDDVHGCPSCTIYREMDDVNRFEGDEP